MNDIDIWWDIAEPPHPRCQRWGFSLLNEAGTVLYQSPCMYNDAEQAKAAAEGRSGSNITRRKDGTFSKRAHQILDMNRSRN